MLTLYNLLSGLERTDNGMKQTSWPDVTPINQKNYYTYVYMRAGGDDDSVTITTTQNNHNDLFTRLTIKPPDPSFSLSTGII